MAKDVYGLGEDDVRRIRTMLAAFESGRLGGSRGIMRRRQALAGQAAGWWAGVVDGRDHDQAAYYWHSENDPDNNGPWGYYVDEAKYHRNMSTSLPPWYSRSISTDMPTRTRTATGTYTPAVLHPANTDWWPHPGHVSQGNSYLWVPSQTAKVDVDAFGDQYRHYYGWVPPIGGFFKITAFLSGAGSGWPGITDSNSGWGYFTGTPYIVNTPTGGYLVPNQPETIAYQGHDGGGFTYSYPSCKVDDFIFGVPFGWPVARFVAVQMIPLALMTATGTGTKLNFTYESVGHNWRGDMYNNVVP